MNRVRQILAAAASFAALLVAAPGHAAEPSVFASLDINKAQGWADALAACDMTRFFLSNPDLEAGTIIAPGGGILYKPLFIPEKTLYTPSLNDALDTLVLVGQVKREEVVKARFQFASTLIPRFHKAGEVDKAFLKDQMKLCNVLTDDVKKRYGG
ncbi:hypothetical protein ASD21_20850 [Caulobacter sp. Root1455]|uniref:hypothetical protein n=1 Tax=Caulobacter sp. Root1455 TaxID=1736465 RepID=UPI0007011F0C|nr:hypothetical protein [Caulobacter sp. Root1455]KQZ03253.1 hypothetical protein ASD21_20850 [Caulobacter sp. Root1455]